MLLERNEYHLVVTDENVKAVELLAVESGLSRQKIKQAMQKGVLWITDDKGTHRLRRQSQKLHRDSRLHFYFDPLILNARTYEAILVADEGEYSVWYKPRGMLSQGSKWGDHCTINRWVEQNLMPQRPAFIVHRLDRFATGLILIAHKKKAATVLSALFQNRIIKKNYKVIVHGQFPNEPITFTHRLNNKSAISHVSLLEYDAANNYSVLLVEIETGRKHQIRCHLSGAGYPVVGDRLYGYKEDNSELQLTAIRLSFQCPLSAKERKYTLAEALQPSLKRLSDLSR